MMDHDDSAGMLAGVLLVLLGMGIGVILSGGSIRTSAYKEGQLDAQRGNIEWLLLPDGAIHHIE